MPEFRSVRFSVEELALLGQNPEAQRGLQILTGFGQDALPPSPQQPVSTPQQLLPRVQPGFTPPPTAPSSIDLGQFDQEVEALSVTSGRLTEPRPGPLSKAAGLAAAVVMPSLFLLLKLLHPRRLPWVLAFAGAGALAVYLLSPVENNVGEAEPVTPSYSPAASEPHAPDPVEPECSSAFPCDLPQ